MAKSTIPSVLTKGLATKTTRQPSLDLEDPATRQSLEESLGIGQQQKQLNPFERITGLLDMFRPTDDIRKGQKEGFLAGVGDYFGDIVKGIGGAITGNDYRDETDKEGGAEILKSMGIDNGIANGVGGFVLDVLLDPTTYVTIGTGSGTKIATKEGAKALTGAGAKLFTKTSNELVKDLAVKSSEELAQVLAKEGIEEMAGKTVKEIADHLASKKVYDLYKSGVKTLKPLGLAETDKLAQQILKEGVFDQGGFKFAGKKIFNLNPLQEKGMKAYFDPISTGFGIAKKVPVLGETIEGAEKGLKELGGTVGQLFSRKKEFTGGNIDRFGNLYDATNKMTDFLSGQTADVAREYTGMFKTLTEALQGNEDAMTALPHLIENIPEEKLKLLPEEVQQAITKLTTNPSNNIINNVVEKIIPQEIQPKNIFDTIGIYKNITDQNGIQKKVFKPTLTEKNIQTLAEQGINSPEDFKVFIKDKKSYVPMETPYNITKEKIEELSRTRAGKLPEVKAIKDQIDAITQNPRVQKMLVDYDEIQYALDQKMFDDIDELVDEYNKIGMDGEQARKTYNAYQKYFDKVKELKWKYEEVLTKAQKETANKTIIKEIGYKAGMTPYDNLMTKLGKTKAEMQKVERNILDSIKVTKNTDDVIEKKIMDIKKFVDPKLQDWFDKTVSDVTERTDWLVERGYIKGKTKANYLGRVVTKTPSGVVLDESAKKLGVQGKAVSQMLNPKSAVNQKHRVYDYLVDLMKAGGETEITKATGKEATAQLMEQMAKDKIKYNTAREFENLASQILSGKIADSSGNKLYHTATDIVESMPEEFKSLNKYVSTMQTTGKIPEPIKLKLENMGYKQLTIPAFKDAWFDKESYDVITKMHKSFFGDEATNAVVRIYDKVNNLIKKSQTVMFPAFHVRNMFSNIFSNFTNGLKNPERYKEAIEVQNYIKALDKGDTALIEKLGQKSIGQHTIEDVYKMAAHNGVISSNFFSDLSEKLVEKPSGILSKMNPLSDNFALQKAGKNIEENARLALFLDRLNKGDDVTSAALKVKEVLFDYNDLTKFEKNVLKRFVPYYCVPVTYEILTELGWKKHNEIEKGIKVLTYNVKKHLLEWQPLIDKAIFNFDGELKHISQRRYDFLCTRDHRWAVCDYKKDRKIKRAYQLNSGDKIPLTAPLENKPKTIGVRLATIIGWIVTDGYMRNRGNYTEYLIYQSPKKYLNEIIDLIGEDGKATKPNQNGVIPVRIHTSLGHKLQKYIKHKSDILKIVTSLNAEESKAMLTAMLKAEGSFRNDKAYTHFAQDMKNPYVRDAFQILALQTNQTANLSTRGAYLKRNKYIKIYDSLSYDKPYVGEIWCPKTPNGTWIMRNNGTPIITGNTWTRKNAEQMLKMIAFQPGKFGGMIKGYNNIQKAVTNFESGDNEKLPDWVKQGLGLGMKNGDDVTMITQFGLPIEAFQQLLNSNPLNQLGTVPKTVIEVGTGQNIFKNQAILDDTSGKTFKNFPDIVKQGMNYREEKRKDKNGKEYTVYYVDPWAKYWLNNLLGRTVSTTSKVSMIGENDGVEADLLNLFTGLKKYNFNLTEEEAKRNKEKAKNLYDILLKMGKAKKYTNVYIPKDEKTNLLNQIGK